MTSVLAIMIRKNLNAGSDRLISCQFVHVRIIPHRKNNTSDASPIACNAPCIFIIICQISPPLNVSGDSVRSNHISASFAFQAFTIDECV